MRRVTLGAAVVAGGLALLPAAGRAAPPIEPASFARFCDSTMTALLERDHIPGAVLTVVQNGQVLLSKGYGYSDLERRAPVDPERTVFRVASVSKLVTATAAMQLVERGKLDLHQDVNRTLRRFQIESRPDGPVTLFHLLTHTAGFDDRNIERKTRRASDAESLGAYLARRMPPRVLPAGEFIAYSNHGMALAGELVEEASGQPFERFVAENLFRPLGMERSSFSDAGPDSERAVGYDFDDGRTRRVPRDFTRTVPASMLSTTGSDMAKFMLAHLANGQLGSTRILADSTAGAMHDGQFTQNPLLPGIGFGFWERFQRGERAIWHDGDAEGFSSLLVLFPGRDLGIFLACNGRGGGRARVWLLDAFLDHYPPDSLPAEPPAAAFRGAPPLKAFEGTYLYNRYSHRSLEKLVTLGSEIPVFVASDSSIEFQKWRYRRVGPALFRREDGDRYLAFRMDPGGQVTHLFAGQSIARVYERLPWHATTGFFAGGLLFCLLAFLSAVIVGLVARARRRAPEGRPAGVSRGLAAAVGALGLLFAIGMVAFLAGSPEEIQYRVPRWLVALLAVPLVSTGLGVLLTARVVAAWNRSRGSTLERLHVSWVALAALGFAALLQQWNLLGFHF